MDLAFSKSSFDDSRSFCSLSRRFPKVLSSDVLNFFKSIMPEKVYLLNWEILEWGWESFGEGGICVDGFIL